MIKKISALFCLCSIIFATSCQKNDIQKNDKLSIYISTEFMREFSDGIEFFKEAFPQTELEFINTQDIENNAAIETQIMAGKGPDVIFIERDNMFKDVNKTIATGVFSAMDRYLKNDNKLNVSDFYPSILNAGKYNDMQCVLPIFFNVPIMLTTQEILNEYKLNLTRESKFSDFNSQIIEFADTEESGQLPRIVGSFRDEVDYWGYSFLDWMPLTDYQEQCVNFDREELELACKAFKAIIKHDNGLPYNLIGWGAEQSSQELSDKTSMMDTINYKGSSFNLLQAASLLNAENTPIFLPINNSDGGIHAKITLGVAINSNSKSKDVAFEFIKSILLKILEEDQPKPQYHYSLKVANENQINQLKKQFDTGYLHGLAAGTGGNNKAITPLRKEFVDNYINIYNNITTCGYYSRTTEIIYDAFSPYFNDKATLESCLETAQSAMEIYISE